VGSYGGEEFVVLDVRFPDGRYRLFWPADQADHRLTKSSLPLRYTSYVIGVHPVTAVTLPITTPTSGRCIRGDRTPLPRDR
jgi:hypothetical protein